MKLFSKKCLYSLLIVVSLMGTCSCGTQTNMSDIKPTASAVEPTPTPLSTSAQTTTNNPSTTPKATKPAIPKATDTPKSSSALNVDVIDVGQGLSILLECDCEFMLIDAGDANASLTILNHLQSKNVDKLAYFCVTHSHNDHYGSAMNIINNYDIDAFLFNPENNPSTFYQQFLYDVNSSSLNPRNTKPGDTFKLGSATITILGPFLTSLEPNNNSIVLLVENANKKLLITADAQSEEESDIVDNYKALISDVETYIAGHHGSNLATSDKLLNAMPNLKTCIISVGSNNMFGHPHSQTLDKLNAKGITILRTDLNKTQSFTLE